MGIATSLFRYLIVYPLLDRNAMYSSAPSLSLVSRWTDGRVVSVVLLSLFGYIDIDRYLHHVYIRKSYHVIISPGNQCRINVGTVILLRWNTFSPQFNLCSLYRIIPDFFHIFQMSTLSTSGGL